MIQPFFAFYDWAILFLRVALGVILIAHGFPKLKDLGRTSVWMASIGLRPGVLFAFPAALLEFFGGIALIVGFLTQAVAVLVALQFAFIVLKVNRARGLVGGYEFDLLILSVSLLLATTGGGALGLDDALGVFIY
ncbi:MAG: DoxX family protein [Candidatus Brennerbacteria bacterium]|nr:DoxX family protein [Candidatus Brennerbacteria bacterium]